MRAAEAVVHGLSKAGQDWDRLNDHKSDGAVRRVPYVCLGVPESLVPSQLCS